MIIIIPFRFIRSIGIIDTVSARKFLEAALNCDDQMLFYTVFKFFEQRNIRLRGSPKFPSGWSAAQCLIPRYFQKLQSLMFCLLVLNKEKKVLYCP